MLTIVGFGAAQNYEQAAAARFVGGFFNGITGCATALAELTFATSPIAATCHCDSDLSCLQGAQDHHWGVFQRGRPGAGAVRTQLRLGPRSVPS